MRNRVVWIIFFCAAVSIVKAQIVTWAVKPGIYSKIEHCWENMYFVYQDDNIGVVDGCGKVIVPEEASRITGFFDGCALVLKSDGGQELILGILGTNGNYKKVDGTYYVIPYQEFFSEGLLSVIDVAGKAAFMNVNGIIVHKFDTDYASPFSEGYAMVGSKETFHFVDKNFNRIRIKKNSMSPIYGGGNVYNGEALVWDGNGKFYRVNMNSGVAVSTKAPKSDAYDYLCCFQELTGRSQDVSYEKTKHLRSTLQAKQEGGKYGYESDDKIILPCQLEKAGNFEGQTALVRLNGKDGLLQLHQTGENYSIVATNDHITYKKSNQQDIIHKFSIGLPMQWNDDQVSVILSNPNGATINTTHEGTAYEFKADGTTGSMTYSVEFMADGMRLWSGEITYDYTKEAEPQSNVVVVPKGVMPFTVTLKTNNTKADRNHHCYVTAFVTNPNSEAITATVTFTGSNLLESVSKRVTVPAHGTKEVTSYFNVVKVATKQKVTVTTSAGGTDSLDGLQLIPFD